jgi:putative ABC transport system substrate-binding protein
MAIGAQQAQRLPTVGYLSDGPSGPTPGGRAFEAGLREHGYIPEKNVVLERRSAEGRPERLADLAAELVRLRVDLIVAESAYSGDREHRDRCIVNASIGRS